MKVPFLITGCLVLVSLTTFAQKGEVSNAQTKYNNYTVEKANKLTLKQGNEDIDDAQKSIDKATVNPKTSALPLAWALKGAIYSELVLRDSVPSTAAPLFTTADDALKQAKIHDSVKNENKALIHSAYLNLAQYRFNEGRAEYQNKKYEDAYKSFDYFRQVLPDDTLSMYVTGLSAANAALTNPKYYDLAITNYNKLLATNYSQNRAIYYDLTSIYLDRKDTVNAFKTAGQAVVKYPNDNDLRRREIEIGLQSGKQDELIGKIQSAITADPKNKTLYYYEGLTYSQIAEAAESKETKTKDPVAKANLDKIKTDNFGKAADQYKQALAIDPNYFEANLNLGYVIIKPAIDEYNAANELPSNQQKQYDAAIAKSNAEFDSAKPYLQKAVDLNPKSLDALQNLKTYYLGKKDTADANKVQKQIEALPAN